MKLQYLNSIVLATVCASSPLCLAQSKLSKGVLPPMNPESVAFKAKAAPSRLSVSKGDTIAIIGTGLASRMNHFGHFETEIYLTFPDLDLTIRNMGDEGNTPGFRPHPGRNQEQQYAFPGAKELLPQALQASSKPQGPIFIPDRLEENPQSAQKPHREEVAGMVAVWKEAQILRPMIHGDLRLQQL
ncbi:hypothetical protein N9230_03405 [Akkermansiaceae bacterium]|nr:hypothetical protein [Akkermansiaceae bacterium]